MSIEKNLINLINISFPDLDEISKEGFYTYSNRILQSDMTLLTHNENIIVSEILDKLTVEKKTRFQVLYKKLTMMKNKLSKRWAVFYFLNQLSSLVKANYSNVKNHEQGIFSTILNNFNDKNNIDNLNNQYHNNFSAQSKLKPIQQLNESVHHIKHEPSDEANLLNTARSRLAVNKYKSNKIITEKDIIYDLIYVFQGIDGHYINYSSLTDSFVLNPLVPFNDSIINIVNHLSELGFLFKKIKELIDYFQSLNSPSQILQAFICSINHELSQYYKLISHFNQSVSIEKDSDKGQEVTLKRLFLWIMEPMEKMKWIAIVCDACVSIKGIPIISQLYSYVKYTNAYFLKNVLFTTSQPLFYMIRDWVIYGQINDSSEEFFIRINNIKEEDKIWDNKYSLIYENIPNFSDREFYEKIFLIGKSIHYIKNYCKLPHFSLNQLTDRLMVEEEEFIQNKEGEGITKIINKKPLRIIFSKEPINCLKDIPSFKREIDIIHQEVNKYLISLLFEKFYLMEHLKMINCYFLMGQGDMIQYLMDLLTDELNKPISQLQKHNLRSKLDTAISSSNAQYHQFKYNLDVKIDESSGDIGWDAFYLTYLVEQPLKVIFTSDNLLQYQKLFFFLMKVKRLEYSNNHEIWRKIMVMSRTQKKDFDITKIYLNKTMLFNQQVIHFFSTFNNYIFLEVLETQTKTLVSKLKNIKNLDDFISYHKEFIEKVTEQCLLNNDNMIIYKNIMVIIDNILNFKMLFDLLNNSVMEYYIREQDIKKYGIDEMNDHAYIEQTNKHLKTSYERITLCFDEFKNNVSSLIKTLEVIGKGRFKYLAMKLDYNGFYSDWDMKKFSNNNNNDNQYNFNMDNAKDMNQNIKMNIDNDNENDNENYISSNYKANINNDYLVNENDHNLDKYELEYNNFKGNNIINDLETSFKHNDIKVEKENDIFPSKKLKIVYDNRNIENPVDDIEDFILKEEVNILSKREKENSKKGRIVHDNEGDGSNN